MDGRRIDSKRNFCPRNLLDRVVDNYVASLDMAQLPQVASSRLTRLTRLARVR